MTTQPKTSRIPAPLYAAAGAGGLAYQQLRKLPAVVSELRTRVAADLGAVNGVELRQKANETLRTATLTADSLRQKAATDLDLQKLREAADLKRVREAADLDRLKELADLDKLREAATRNAAVVVAGAYAAQERALAAYGRLVARGERVVGAGVLEAAETVNTDIETTEAAPTATAAVTPATADVPTPAEVAEVAEAKPATVKKRATRATKATAKPATPSAKLPRATKRTRPAAE